MYVVGVHHERSIFSNRARVTRKVAGIERHGNVLSVCRLVLRVYVHTTRLAR